MEKHYKIYNDDTGEVLLIGPDRDSLGLIEFRYQTDEGKDYAAFTIPSEWAIEIAAIMKDMSCD
jgi:hypothetical protein